MSKPISVVIKKSSKPEKKLMAVFKMDTGRTRTTHFGQAGAPDYTRTRDKEQKSRYLSRHRRRENWDDATSAGALSRWILWDLPTRRASIASYKKRFNL